MRAISFILATRPTLLGGIVLGCLLGGQAHAFAGPRQTLSKFSAPPYALARFTTPGSSRAAERLPQLMHSVDCPAAPALAPERQNFTVGYAAPQSKDKVLLGGAPSMLEKIRMQQNSAATAMTLAGAAKPSEQVNLVADTDLKPLQPAAGAYNATNGCGPHAQKLAFVPSRPAFRYGTGSAITAPPQGDLLASRRIAISRTSFDQEWARVRNQSLSQQQLSKYVGALGHDRLSLIANINRQVNHKIHYVEDSQLFGKADYWAGAGATLRLGKGDCEDIAITKMQLLAAAGVARKDMILTIARDLVRNMDHAVLIVRNEGSFILLDNSTDELLDGSASNDYRPVFSFSEGKSWLHGY